MKTKITFLILGSVLLALVTPLRAQISESESSVNVLAVQCSMSSGFSSADFDDYSRRLAKTLALLSPAQQTRVFGYLPQPGAAMKGDSGSFPGNLQGDLPSNPGKEMAAEKSGETGSSALDGLVAMVGNLNSSLGGGDSAPASAVIAGATLEADLKVPVVGNETAAAASVGAVKDSVADAPELEASATAGLTAQTDAPGAAIASEPAATKSWDALIAWFKAAEDAYKGGTLKEFLQTQP